MKLILAIVAEKQCEDILHMLMTAQYQATVISSTGGFLRKGNTTLLIGVADGKVADVQCRIEDCCLFLPPPERGQASVTLFVLDVDRHLRL